MDYTLENGKLKIEVSDAGGALRSLVGKATNREYLWQGDPDIWNDRAPNLFPYIGRLYEGTYTYKGQKYNFKNHGLVRYFTLHANHTNQELVFELQDNEETRKAYPFRFLYKVRYRLEGGSLHITYEVENQDDKTMYFGVGGHPGFNVPIVDGLEFEDYYVAFDEGIKPDYMVFSEDFLNAGTKPYDGLVGNRLPLTHSLFDLDAIVLEGAGSFAEIASDKSPVSIRVDFPDMRYVGIWHKPKTQATYVCIEPWSSLPGRSGVMEDLEEQPDLVALEAGKTYRNEWMITIKE